jgi:hypothetical protein
VLLFDEQNGVKVCKKENETKRLKESEKKRDEGITLAGEGTNISINNQHYGGQIRNFLT